MLQLSISIDKILRNHSSNQIVFKSTTLKYEEAIEKEAIYLVWNKNPKYFKEK